MITFFKNRNKHTLNNKWNKKNQLSLDTLNASSSVLSSPIYTGKTSLQLANPVEND